MDAEAAWGAAFIVYILIGLYPMSNSAVKETDHFGNGEYRRRFNENFWRRIGPLLIWCTGLVALLVAWKIYT